MTNTTVRIESIEIKNFKNVGYGHLDFEESKKGGRASILGLYGQNGSGKTALIDALELLRFALSGRAIPAYFADYINVDSENATLKYGFKVNNQSTNCIYSVFYEVNLRRDIDNTEHNTERLAVDDHYKAVLFNEVAAGAMTEWNVWNFIGIDKTADADDIAKAVENRAIKVIDGTMTINVLVEADAIQADGFADVTTAFAAFDAR